MPKKENPLRQLPANSEEYGDIRIHLDEILEKRNISLNQLSFRTEMQRTQLRNYRDNKIQRLDIDILKRLCYVLECDLHDLVEYIPPKWASRYIVIYQAMQTHVCHIKNSNIFFKQREYYFNQFLILLLIFVEIKGIIWYNYTNTIFN